MKSIILFFIVVITSCASSQINENSNLIDIFLEYKYLSKSENERVFFEANLWDFIVKSRLNSKRSVFSDSLSKFPGEIIEISDSKESIYNKTGCLLVSGVNKNNIPMDYYITYGFAENQWIIRDITVKYFFEGTKRFLTEAVCDEEERARLWLEFIENN